MSTTSGGLSPWLRQMAMDPPDPVWLRMLNPATLIYGNNSNVLVSMYHKPPTPLTLAPDPIESGSKADLYLRTLATASAPSNLKPHVATSSACARALILLHVALGVLAASPKLPYATSQHLQAEVAARSDALTKIVSLPDKTLQLLKSSGVLSIANYNMINDCNRKDTLESFRLLLFHWFAAYIVKDAFLLKQLHNLSHNVRVALAVVVSALGFERCQSCQCASLIISFWCRLHCIDVAAEDTSPKALIPMYELSLLDTLGLPQPSKMNGIRHLLSSIAHLENRHGQNLLNHSEICQKLYPAGALETLFGLMYDLTNGMVAPQNTQSLTTSQPARVMNVNEFVQAIEEKRKMETARAQQKDQADAYEADTPANNVGGPSQQALPPKPLTATEAVATDLLTAAVEQSADAILKGTVFDSSWTIHFHDRSEKILRRIVRKNNAILLPVVKNLLAVANGHWTESVACALVAPNCPVVLYECKVLNNLRIVWQVDVAYLECIQRYSQVIKVWCIGNHNDVVEVVKYIEAAQKSYSPEHIKRCKHRNVLATGRVHPEIWPEDGGDLNYIVSVEEFMGVDAMDALMMHEMAVTAKYIPFSKMLIRWLIAAEVSLQDCEFPFAVSEQEHRILLHENSSIVCGRSGTGKTSCCIFRLLAHLHARKLLLSPSRPPPVIDEDEPVRKFRQIFITASPRFCSRVKAYYLQLSTSINPSSIEYQRLVEFVKTLKDADSSEATAELLEIDNASLNQANFVMDGAEASAMMDDGSDLPLPETFGDLTDDHFPLFVPYRQFISMLRKHFKLDAPDAAVVQDFSDIHDLVDHSDYDRFVRIFESLPRKVTKDIEASLAFNEIMGIIKGSELAARSPEGKLTRAQYVSASSRAYGNFAAKRNQIYDIFEQYTTKMLAEYQDFVAGKSRLSIASKHDDLDRVNELNRVFEKKATEDLQDILINEFYVDEVQDLTMAQILPIVSLCVNPQHGLMLAGDTAQVISRGSTFRFQDLSSMIHNMLKLKNMDKTVIQPEQFSLTRNYRSHDGILSVAASLLDLLKHYFPGLIDALPREAGTILGPKPFVVTDTLHVREFLGGDSEIEGGRIDFGAGQVILVRRADEVQSLKAELGSGFVLVLTVEEAKGMEFRDVVLYNLFTSSPANEQKVVEPVHFTLLNVLQWRLFYEQLDDKTEKFPTFEYEKHSIFSTELKILYTAVTRARSRLWIWDKDKQKQAPLVRYWLEQRLVISSSDTASKSFSFHRESTAEEWREQANMLFDNGRYEDALGSYKKALQKAGMSLDTKTVETLLCEGFIYQAHAIKEARKAYYDDKYSKDSAKVLYAKAAECLLEAKKLKGTFPDSTLNKIGECFEMAGMSERAVEVYKELKVPTVNCIALFGRLGLFELAGAAYEKLAKPIKAVEEYLKLPKMIERTIQIIQSVQKTGQNVDHNILCEVCDQALATIPNGQRQLRRDAIFVLDDSFDKKKYLLRQEEYFDELVLLHMNLNEYSEAADITDCYTLNQYLAALYLTNSERQSVKGIFEAMDLLLRDWWVSIAATLFSSAATFNSTYAYSLSLDGIFLATFQEVQSVVQSHQKLYEESRLFNRLAEINTIRIVCGESTGQVPKGSDAFEFFMINLLQLYSLTMTNVCDFNSSVDEFKIWEKLLQHAYEVVVGTDLIRVIVDNKLPESDILYGNYQYVLRKGHAAMISTAVADRVNSLKRILACFAIVSREPTAYNTFTHSAPYSLFYKSEDIIKNNSFTPEQLVKSKNSVYFDTRYDVVLKMCADSMDKLAQAICVSVIQDSIHLKLLQDHCTADRFQHKCDITACDFNHSPNVSRAQRDGILFFVVLYFVVTRHQHPRGPAAFLIWRLIDSLDPWDRGMFGKCGWIVDKESIRGLPGPVIETMFNFAHDYISMTSNWIRDKTIDVGAMIYGFTTLTSTLEGSWSIIYKAAMEAKSHCAKLGDPELAKLAQSTYEIVHVMTVIGIVEEVVKLLDTVRMPNLVYLRSLTSICWFVELAAASVILASSGVCILPRYVVEASCRKYKAHVRASTDLFDYIVMLRVAIMQLMTFASEGSNATDLELIRLGRCYVWLSLQEEEEDFKLPPFPSWFLLKKPLEIMEHIAKCASDGEKLVLCWREDVTHDNKLIQQTKAMATWHYPLASSKTMFNPSHIQEISAETKSGIQPASAPPPKAKQSDKGENRAEKAVGPSSAKVDSKEKGKVAETDTKYPKDLPGLVVDDDSDIGEPTLAPAPSSSKSKKKKKKKKKKKNKQSVADANAEGANAEDESDGDDSSADHEEGEAAKTVTGESSTVSLEQVTLESSSVGLEQASPTIEKEEKAQAQPAPGSSAEPVKTPHSRNRVKKADRKMPALVDSSGDESSRLRPVTKKANKVPPMPALIDSDDEHPPAEPAQKGSMPGTGKASGTSLASRNSINRQQGSRVDIPPDLPPLIADPNNDDREDTPVGRNGSAPFKQNASDGGRSTQNPPEPRSGNDYANLKHAAPSDLPPLLLDDSDEERRPGNSLQLSSSNSQPPPHSRPFDPPPLILDDDSNEGPQPTSLARPADLPPLIRDESDEDTQKTSSAQGPSVIAQGSSSTSSSSKANNSTSTNNENNDDGEYDEGDESVSNNGSTSTNAKKKKAKKNKKKKNKKK